MDAGRERLAAGGNKTGTTRLGFGLMLKFFELEARFPLHAQEVALGRSPISITLPDRTSGTLTAAAVSHTIGGRPPAMSVVIC